MSTGVPIEILLIEVNPLDVELTRRALTGCQLPTASTRSSTAGKHSHS